MACGVALKRMHDFDDCLLNESDSVKRTRSSVPHCSPFRAQMGTIAASLPSSSSPSRSGGASVWNGLLRSNKEEDDVTSTPFSEISGRCQLSSPQLQSYLKAEIRYLKRRKLIPRRALHSDLTLDQNHRSEQDGLDASSTSASNQQQPRSLYRSPESPTIHSASDSDDGDSSSMATTRPTMMTNSIAQSSSIVSSSRTCDEMSLSITERAMFSLRQVQLICERLLKEQELRLRYEYETVLNKRLEEQHEQYVQFAREQIQRRLDESSVENLSYLS